MKISTANSNWLFSSKDADEEWVMGSKSDHTEIIFKDKADKVVGELLSKYQIGLETTIKCSEFVFDCAIL